MKCEVVGWLFLDAEKPQVLVRDGDGSGDPQPVDLDTGFEHQAIQTGSFRRGRPIVDPATQKTIGYEIEQLARPFSVVR